MQWLKYLQYLTLLGQLVGDIRDAETNFPTKGTGDQKLAFVLPRFLKLIDDVGASGVITPALAAAIKAGAEQIITVVVQVMNATGTMPGPLPATPTPKP